MKRYVVPGFLAAAGIAAAQVAAILLLQYTYAPVGIAPGAALRLNVANTAGGTSVCTGNLSFVNSDGTTIKNQNITVNAGQTVSYPLSMLDVPNSPAGAVVRGVVKIDRQVGGMVGPATVACTSITSLEVVDTATGQTRAVLTNPTLGSGITPVFPGGTVQPQ